MDLPVTTTTLRVRPDVVFTRAKLAIFVDGCFWHGCPLHGSTPKSNQSYWAPKLRRNRERDDEVDLALEEGGWLVIRCWEHDDPEAIVDVIVEARLLQIETRHGPAKDQKAPTTS